MNDVDLLRALPGPVDGPDEATKKRIRTLTLARIDGGDSTSRTLTRRSRRGVRVGVLAVAAVLVAGAAAAAGYMWTADRPIVVPTTTSSSGVSQYGDRIDISDPNGPVSTPAEFASVVSEFAPDIRLPDDGAFDAWRDHWLGLPTSSWSGLIRHDIVYGMVHVSQCQWTQQWLDAFAQGDPHAADEATSVLEGIEQWYGPASVDDSGVLAGLLDKIQRGDSAPVQLSVNQGCAYTGSWGTTPAEQDAKARGDLHAAIPSVQQYLKSGGTPRSFDPSAASAIDSNVFWTWSHMQPVPARPGAVFIAWPSDQAVTLVSVSESGTQFCAVVTETSIGHGTTNADLSVSDTGDGPEPENPAPVTCTPSD